MSRPFSYNDENFTVIGNILFVHLNFPNKAYSAGDKLGTIPPEIYNRMTVFGSLGRISDHDSEGKAGTIYMRVDEDGNILTKNNISNVFTSTMVLNAWFILKDI